MKKLFNIKRLLKARNSSGFTLVEVIISCTLLSILVLGIMSFVTPVLKMLSSGQKNARATMLAETLDTYISGVLRTATMVEVFENVDCVYEYSTASDINFMAYSPDGEGMHKIDEFMRTGENAVNFEVRALGIMTKNTGQITSQGIRLYNIPVENNFSEGSVTLNVQMSKARPAFHDLMFEGLYPIIKLETFKSQDSSGDEVDANAKGYRISSKIYSDSKCYDPLDTQRDKSLLSFEGVTFFENLNYGTRAGVPTEASDIITIASVQDSMDEHGSQEGELFYPATIICYVAPRK